MIQQRSFENYFNSFSGTSDRYNPTYPSNFLCFAHSLVPAHLKHSDFDSLYLFTVKVGFGGFNCIIINLWYFKLF